MEISLVKNFDGAKIQTNVLPTYNVISLLAVPYPSEPVHVWTASPAMPRYQDRLISHTLIWAFKSVCPYLNQHLRQDCNWSVFKAKNCQRWLDAWPLGSLGLVYWVRTPHYIYHREIIIAYSIRPNMTGDTTEMVLVNVDHCFTIVVGKTFSFLQFRSF